MIPVNNIQWSLYFKTIHMSWKLWSYSACGLKNSIVPKSKPWAEFSGFFNLI